MSNGEFLPPTAQEQIEYLENEVLHLQNQLQECLQESIKDSILLDYLNDLPLPPNFGWKLYKSTMGRGWRLATINHSSIFLLNLPLGLYATPREAIQAEIDKGEILLYNEIDYSQKRRA
jgi:hypothetical protein